MLRIDRNETFSLLKYINVLPLPIAHIAVALYVGCKYLFAFPVDSPFLLYVLFSISGK